MRIQIVVVLLFIASAVFAQKSMLYPHLEKGKYDVGYKTIIDFDFARTYNLSYPNDTISRKRDPRPVITNIWYPAKVSKADKAMLYGDYIKIETRDATLKAFVKRMEEYNAKNSSLYMFYSDSLSEGQKKKFAKQLEQPVEVFKNAVAVNEKFPLVIYHAGLGGTLNDNTILCEYLASHGFVVVSGAFQANDYKSVDLDWDLERSTKDLDFMLNRIKTLPFIDFSKIAAIGHSYGAQAVLAYKTEDFSPLSCLIILDSTVDYSFDANPNGFQRLTEKLYGKIKNLNVPMLVFASPRAAFTVIDSLQYSDRVYCTIALNHNEYTSLTSFAVFNDLQERVDKDTVWNKYGLIDDYCLNYLKWNISNDVDAKQFVLAKRSMGPIENVYRVPKGTKLNILDATPAYADYSRPPSYMQFQKIVIAKDKDVIEKIIGLYPKYLNEGKINSMGYSIIGKDVEFAIYLFKKNVELFPESWNVWDSLGEAYMIKGDKDLAVKNYKKSVELNPKNKNGLKMLEKLNR